MSEPLPGRQSHRHSVVPPNNWGANVYSNLAESMVICCYVGELKCLVVSIAGMAGVSSFSSPAEEQEGCWE